MEALQALRKAEPVIYIALALFGLIFIWRFALGWEELRGAAFGLEKEKAQDKLNQAAGVLVAVLSITVVVFVLVSFVAPAAPEALPTPTLNLLATATATLPPGAPTYTPAPGAELTQAAQQTASPLSPVGSGCIPGQVEISMPKPGEEVMGVVSVMGSANIANFGFYKFELKRPNESIWLTIQAGNTPKTNDKLGEWDTTRLTPGEYQLGLVVVDNQAQAMPACVIQLRVARAPEPTTAP